MKCPHCGVHYMDEEKECPVCGKRAGLLVPRKQSKFSKTTQDTSYKPKPKKSSGKSTARKQTYNNQRKSTAAAWQQAAAGQHIHDNPLERKKKKSGCGTGCLIVVIIFIILIALNIGSAINYSSIMDSDSWTDSIDSFFDESYDDDDDLYSWTDIAEMGVGTWSNTDGSVTFTIEEDGTLSWTNSSGSYTDHYPSCYFLQLNDGNQDMYCSEEELKSFSLDSYCYYEFWGYSFDDEDSYSFDFRFYLPADANTLSSTFDYYDKDTGEYGTFTRVSEETEPQGSAPEPTEPMTDTPTSDTPENLLPDTPEQRA